jgi:parvulin-like peptidyl-prolyl isomerase
MSKRTFLEREIKPKVVITDHDTMESSMAEPRTLYHLRIIALDSRQFSSRRKMEKLSIKILDEIRAGTPFETAAKKYSHDPSAQQGGDLGFVPQSSLSPEILAALPSMKPSHISAWIATGDKKLLLLKLVAEKEDTLAPSERVSEEMKNTLFIKELNLQMKIWFEHEKPKAGVKKLPLRAYEF